MEMVKTRQTLLNEFFNLTNEIQTTLIDFENKKEIL